MRWKGWFRLWVALSAVVVPLMAYALARPDMATWESLNESSIRLCVDQEANLPSHPNATACVHATGADQTVFQREHTTPLTYWSEALLAGLVADLVLTGVIVGIIAVALWVRRGFGPGHTRI